MMLTEACTARTVTDDMCVGPSIEPCSPALTLAKPKFPTLTPTVNLALEADTLASARPAAARTWLVSGLVRCGTYCRTVQPVAPHSPRLPEGAAPSLAASDVCRGAGS